MNTATAAASSSVRLDPVALDAWGPTHQIDWIVAVPTNLASNFRPESPLRENVEPLHPIRIVTFEEDKLLWKAIRATGRIIDEGKLI